MTGEAATKGGRQRKKQKDKKQKYKERPNACIRYIYIKPPIGWNQT